MSSSGPRCQKTSHLKLISFVSVSSVLFLSSCGPWCQKTLILSWFALFLSLLCSFCLLVGLGAQKTLILSWLALFLSLLCSFCLLVGLGVKNSHLKLICFVSVSSVLFLFLWALVSKNYHLFGFCLFCAFSVFLWALVSINCLFCALSVFLWALVSNNSHLKLICFVSVSSVLFLSSCGPWCQKTLSLSWFALFLSLLCSFCLLVGLGVKKLSS